MSSASVRRGAYIRVQLNSQLKIEKTILLATGNGIHCELLYCKYRQAGHEQLQNLYLSCLFQDTVKIK